MQTSLGEIYCNVVAVWVKIVLETSVHNHYPIPYGSSPYKNYKVQKASLNFTSVMGTAIRFFLHHYSQWVSHTVAVIVHLIAYFCTTTLLPPCPLLILSIDWHTHTFKYLDHRLNGHQGIQMQIKKKMQGQGFRTKKELKKGLANSVFQSMSQLYWHNLAIVFLV